MKFNCAYSALNTARSALSACVKLDDDHKELGTHPDICRFLSGVFQETPARPRYDRIWDASIVLNKLKEWSPGKYLPDKLLTCKLATLIMLVTGQRVQTLHALNLENMSIQSGHVSFFISDKLKQFRPGHNSMTIVLKKFRDEPKLCVVNYLSQYLRRTRNKRSSNYLFISTQKPFGRVTTDTISRWIKFTLGKSGIDTKTYGAHSVRTASSSAARQAGVPMEDIMKNCGWSSSTTFAKWYDKPVEQSNSFASGVLKSNSKN